MSFTGREFNKVSVSKTFPGEGAESNTVNTERQDKYKVINMARNGLK